VSTINKTLSWQEILNNHPIKFSLELKIHPFNNGKIIVNYPGAFGSVDGYMQKYKILAEYIVSQSLASVVRLPNPQTINSDWNLNLEHALNYIIDNSKTICDSDNPEIFLMGLSAGAGAIATLAWKYPQVKKILLLEPALMTGDGSLVKGIMNYQGEVYVVVGSGDEAIGTLIGNMVVDNALKASRKEIFVIPNCDHQFKGEANSRIMSQAPFYAFSDTPKIKFPNLKGGIKLYD
jgi:hypothetical protein